MVYLLHRATTATLRTESLCFEATQSGSINDPYAFDERERAGPSGVQLSESRLRVLSTLVSRAFQEGHVEQLAIPDVSFYDISSQ